MALDALTNLKEVFGGILGDEIKLLIRDEIVDASDDPIRICLGLEEARIR